MTFKIVFSMCYAIESHTRLTDICKQHMRSASLIPFPLYFFDTELLYPSLDGNVHVFVFNCSRLFGTPWTVAHQAPSVHGIFQARILEWVAFPSPGALPHPGIEPVSPALASRFLLLLFVCFNH